MVIDTSLLLAGVGMAAGTLGWSFQQKGRIDTLDKELQNYTALNLERHADTRARLERIEDKLDQLFTTRA